MDIDLPSNSIDYVILSHVLEHVEDDTKVLKEIKRILVQKGKLFLQVPLSKKQKTVRKYLNSVKDRLANYGQADHVRLFDKEDLIHKLINVGFNLSVYEAEDKEYKKIFYRMALDMAKESKMLYGKACSVFVCQNSVI